MVDTRGERRVIGRPASEAEGVQWIRGFKEGETQLRILEPASDWWKYPEHYDASLNYFACNSATNDPDPENCIGCAHPSERTQNRSFKYAFNAIDKEGKVRVFKLGGKIRKTLRQREQTLGRDVLPSRDILIIRTGTGFGGEDGTQYSYEWAGEPYELEDMESFLNDRHDLGEVVTESYWEAVRKLEEEEHGDGEADVAADAEGVDDGETAAAPPAKKTTPAKKAAAPAKKTAAPAKKAAAAKPEPAVEVVDDGTPGPDGETGEVLTLSEDDVAAMIDKLREWDSDDIRSHLDDNGVEFPQRCPKPRLLAIAEQALIDGKLPPF